MRRAGSDLAWRELSAAWCEAFGFSPEVDDVGDGDNFRELDARNLARIRRAGEAFCGSVAFAALGARLPRNDGGCLPNPWDTAACRLSATWRQ